MAQVTTPSNLPNVDTTIPVPGPLSSLPALNTQSAVIKPGAAAADAAKVNEANLSTKQQLASAPQVNITVASGPNKTGAAATPQINPASPVPAGYDPATGMPIGWTPTPQPTSNTNQNSQTQQNSSSAATADATKLAATDPYAQSVLDAQNFSDTQQGKDYYDAYNKAATQSLTLTEAQETEAKQAGVQAGMRYDSLIADAKLKGEKGKASNFVSAAKAGGLDSSAWAGVAALVGAPAGVENFEGIGGALESMASAYDQVVANLKSDQQQAIIAAEAARREYLLTKNDKALKVASDQFDKAKSLYDDQIALNMNKSNVLQSYQEHLSKTTKEAYEAASTDIENLTKSGLATTNFTDEKKRNLELSLRLPYNSFDTYYQAQLDANTAKTQEEKIKAATSTIDLLNKIPVGQKIKIGDAEYEGLGEDKNIVTYKETDKYGNVLLLEYNKSTKEVQTVKTGVQTRVPGSGSGGGTTDAEKKQAKLITDAAEMIEKLDTSKISWGAAFDTLKLKYPEAEPDTINGLLGGGVPYDSATGAFDTNKAFGRAIPKEE